jgi:hypothetical protein
VRSAFYPRVLCAVVPNLTNAAVVLPRTHTGPCSDSPLTLWLFHRSHIDLAVVPRLILPLSTIAGIRISPSRHSRSGSLRIALATASPIGLRVTDSSSRRQFNAPALALRRRVRTADSPSSPTCVQAAHPSLVSPGNARRTLGRIDAVFRRSRGYPLQQRESDTRQLPLHYPPLVPRARPLLAPVRLVIAGPFPPVWVYPCTPLALRVPPQCHPPCPIPSRERILPTS